jgi:O-antigen/teichoic acid export membrane protein
LGNAETWDAAAEKVKSEPSTSHHDLSATIGRNTVFGVLANAAQVATRLVTIPIVIAHLGLDGYGVWSIIMTVASYIRFGSAGVKSAFQKYVADATGNGDFEGAERLLSTGCSLMLVISVIGLVPIELFSRQIAKAAGVPPGFLSATAGSISVLGIIITLSNVGAVYEAIVMGGHRIDIARKFTVLFTVAEAIAIVVVLHLGYGLLAMAWIMAVSEAGFVFSCYLAAKKVVPEIHLRAECLTRSLLHELIRFAGSYQLVNVLEVLYAAILPFAILRAFGANSAGVYAIVTRLVASAMMLQTAFLLPILSGAAMVYASGSTERMKALLVKSFKVTSGLTLFPLGFISAFGAIIVYAWTGQELPSVGGALRLVSVAGLFSGFSVLQLVLYRASGRAIMDNIRQALRIAVLASISVFARRLGFTEVLSGLAIAELIGAVFMIFALKHTFRSFEAKALIPDAVKLTAATASVLVVGIIATRIPLPGVTNGRWLAMLKLGEASLASLLLIWPALLVTKAMTVAEGRAIFSVIFRLRKEKDRRVASVVSG